MSSVSQVVSAMSKEVNNSTLGWDVVVNYTAKEINAVLQSAYDKGGQGQLKEIQTSLSIEEEISGIQYTAVYTFELGAPLIQFEGSPLVASSCNLDIPVTGGSVVVEEYNKEYTIPAGRYRLALTGIALASVNGTQGANRNPQPSDQPFVFQSANTTGAVTIDIQTSAQENRLQVELSIADDSGDKIGLVDTHLADLEKKIVTNLQQSGSIQWDIAQVNNVRPSSGTTQLVPKVFRFACYKPDDASQSSTYSILSIFIYLEGGSDSGTQAQLQEKWSIQWGQPDAQFPGSYGVPPIPNPYTASIIINHNWIQKAVAQSLQNAGMRIEEVPKTSSDNFAIKDKIWTGKQYKVDRMSYTGAEWPYSVYIVDGVNFSLDGVPAPLYLALGQNGESFGNALVQWSFSYTTGWSWIHGSTGQSYSGDVKINNTLDRKISFDNNVLTDYRIHLNLNVQKNMWSQSREPSNSQWYSIIGATDYADRSYNALPDPPTFNLELFDIDFFMTTNLLMPNQNVINFNADPGVLFPRDLYLVGDVIDQATLSARRAAKAAGESVPAVAAAVAAAESAADAAESAPAVTSA